MNNHEILLKRCFPEGTMLDGDEDEMWDKYFPKEIANEMKKISMELNKNNEPFK